jgi:hypothetical protein
MKKTIITILLLAIGFGLNAQNKAIEQIFEKYSDRDSVSTVVINKNMFQLFANVDDPGNDDFLKTVKNLEFIKILTISDERECSAFYQEVLKAIPEKDYKELMTIKESGSQVKFLTAERDGAIRELLMISGGKKESSLIWLAGIIDMKTVSKIAKGMQIDGMENLEKAEKKE